MGLFTDLRAIAELKKQRIALERIASVLEALLLNKDAESVGGRATGLRSFYNDESETAGEVAMTTDEEFAEFEREEQERMRAGGKRGDDEL